MLKVLFFPSKFKRNLNICVAFKTRAGLETPVCVLTRVPEGGRSSEQVQGVHLTFRQPL